MVCGPDEIYSVAQGTELLVVLLTIYIQGAEQVLPYNETGPRISRRADRGDRERSLGLEPDSSRWRRRPVHKRLGAPYMRFSARAAVGVPGDETLTHGLPTAGCKIATLTLD